MGMHGLNDELVEQMKAVFQNHPSVQSVVLFGSRAMQKYRIGSDIDLAIKGPALTMWELLDLQIELEELGLLYKFDVKDFKKIKNPDLIHHIQRVGREIYQVAC